MWEAIKSILVSGNGGVVLVSVLFIFAVVCVAVKGGLVKIRTSHLEVGRVAHDDERAIIRQQIEWAHVFIMSLESKLDVNTERYNGYFTKYILERVYDEVVNWITFNHLSVDSDYINIKQDKICSLVYGLNVQDQFKTPEFKERMRRWVKEVIERLVLIRTVYKDQQQVAEKNTGGLY